MIPDDLVTVCMLSVFAIGMAVGRCWFWSAEKDLRDANRQLRALVYDLATENSALQHRCERQNAEIRSRARAAAVQVGHPSAPSWGRPVAGGDDPSLADLRRQQ